MIKERVSPKLQHEIMLQNDSRFAWKQHDDPGNLDAFILQETEELREAVDLALIGAGAFELASELGDVFYLFIKRIFSSETQPDPRVIEAMLYAIEIADTAGIDINQAVAMKIMRNDMKYLHGFTNNGYTYEKSRDLSKRQWTLMGGDTAFSEMYMELAEDLTSDKEGDTVKA